eukprot:TRINITY_DN5_c0_g1_i1.p1 TRINITY_DN5_c0_g1~~TRINITY_DN5_c0_g1_i1.p1  ORF type:complete len:380 (+),score=44.35 TRINITY_DN5_c0_g1_i1:65-1204(+)
MLRELISLLLLSLTVSQIQIHRNADRANGAGKMPLVNGQDMQYYGVFTMGTPAQPGIKLIFDTGSDQFWINDVNGNYHSKNSKTANITSKSGNITYGSGAVAGHMGTEVIGLPSLALSNIKMSCLFADNMTGMGNQTDGLLGLGATTAINWVEQAYKQKLIPDQLFAFDLRNQDVATYFFVSSTSFPTNDQPAKLHWEKTDWGMYKRWMMSIESTTINNKTEKTALWYRRADVDSGTSLVMFSQGAWDMLWNDPLVNTYCQFNQDYGVHICPCTAPSNSTNSTYPGYPNVNFKTGGGQNLVIVPDDYMVKLNGVYCVLGFQANTYILQLPMMIFGDCFMRNYFVAYNKNDKKIGFSDPESTGTTYKSEYSEWQEKAFLQ